MALMSTPTPIASCSFNNLRNKPGLKPRASVLNPQFRFQNSENIKRSCFLGIGSNHSFIRQTPRGLGIRSSVQPEPPLPSEPPSDSWQKASWIIGALITFAIPFFRDKWGPLLQLTNKVETTIETADSVVEITEEVAGKVETGAEKIADELPEGGKIKDAVELIENMAEEIVNDAKFVDETLDKAEEIDKELDSFMIDAQAKTPPEEAKDEK